jgi:hypothetical protein
VPLFPLLSILGLFFGFVFDLGYFSQFDQDLFFVMSIYDHFARSLIWIIGTFASTAFIVAFRITDYADTGRDTGYIWIGNAWVRFGLFILTGTLFLFLPFHLNGILALFLVLLGFAEFASLVHQRKVNSQTVTALDCTVPIVLFLFAAFFGGISQYHRDIDQRPNCLISTITEKVQEAVLLRSFEGGMISYYPQRRAVVFTPKHQLKSVTYFGIDVDKPRNGLGYALYDWWTGKQHRDKDSKH